MNGRVDNVMTIDSWWNETDYGVPYRKKANPWDDPFIDAEWDDGWDDDDEEWEDEDNGK